MIKMHSIFKINKEDIIELQGIPKKLLMGGSTLFLIQNLLYYVFLFHLSLDVLGAFFFAISFFLLFYDRKSTIFLVTAIFYLIWMMTTLTWRFLIYQNPESLEENLEGYPIILTIFGISATMYFISSFLFFKIVTNSENFKRIFHETKGFIELYLRAYVLYLLLHLNFSFGIVIVGLNPAFSIMWELTLFFKILVVPLFGIFVFGGLIYLFSKNGINLKKSPAK